MKQLPLHFGALAAPSLHTFLPGPNQEVLQALERWMQDEGDALLYLWGRSGTGKTHLLEAACRVLKQQSMPTYWLPADLFVERVAADIPGHAWVVLDNVEQLSTNGQIAVFALINHLREEGGRLLAAGHAPPVELLLRQDLTTRLGWGLVYQLQPLDETERVHALLQAAQLRGIELPDAVVNHLLSHAPRDLKSLTAILSGLDEYALSQQRRITLPLLKDALQDFLPTTNLSFLDSLPHGSRLI